MFAAEMKQLVYIITLFMLLSCTGKEKRDTCRSVYYWSTTFSMDSAKTAFLHAHHIKKMYVRYFDVIIDANGNVMPNATIDFRDKMPRGIDIIPVVFIVNDCMKKDISDLHGKILARILQMNETNDVAGVKEIQIDCDWTRSTRNAYFAFLRRLHTAAAKHGIRLSTTIRLHQLAESPPPVDRGVLMMYNTGDFTDIRCANPILDMKDVAPYLHRIGDYRLPLSTAYPVFSYRLLFRGGHYVGVLHADDDLPILPGDSTITRRARLGEVLSARDAIDDILPDANNEMILYDINNIKTNRIKCNDYEKIYLR